MAWNRNYIQSKIHKKPNSKPKTIQHISVGGSTQATHRKEAYPFNIYDFEIKLFLLSTHC